MIPYIGNPPAKPQADRTALRPPSAAHGTDDRLRAAVLAVRDAERRYLELLEDRYAPRRVVALNWLELCHAERYLDRVLDSARLNERA